MNMRLAFLATLLWLFISAKPSTAQTANFDVGAYRAFLASHNDISTSQLLSMHPAGTFARSIPALSTQPLRLDSIERAYPLTSGEQILLGTNGFVVSERLAPGSFGQGFANVWKADLPVFISTDAILHALHKSYDEILKQSEQQYIIPRLKNILLGLDQKMPSLMTQYGSNPAIVPSLMDLDLYVTVARSLLTGQADPRYAGNALPLGEIMQKITNQTMATCAPMFGDSARLVDYSQFVVRGHYTQSPELSRYFQTMMWLGRIEFYLSPPANTAGEYTRAQIQRQAVAAVLFSELTTLAGAAAPMAEIDALLRYFVGDPDNVTLTNLKELIAESAIGMASDLLDTTKYDTFLGILQTKPWSGQRILSQILIHDPFSPESIVPAGAFIPLGQRFIIDSYISGNVVFDKIEYAGALVWRGLPSPLDVMYALGNDPAAQLLQPDLDAYHYAENLAALRYLVDSYEPGYWKETFFNGWLHALRALNAPPDRSGLPSFMTTAAWWQEKMNTQLASWAQLRHDNILYGKQSYTGGTMCSYPCGYVEPNPALFERIDTLMRTAEEFFKSGPSELTYFTGYFSRSAIICSTLTSIATKELNHSALTPEDDAFLRNTLFIRTGVGCGGDVILGWYPTLFYIPGSQMSPDFVVADVHTCPTDAGGVPVGWVLHVGTGPVNMAVVVADIPDIGPSAFVGPVMSYYQRVTSGFKRFTDEEWLIEYGNAESIRPSWVNAYLADKNGNMRPSGDMLMTEVGIPTGGGILPTGFVLEQNFPNPFNPSTQIHYGLPEDANVSITIFDILGRNVVELVNGHIQAGYHSVTWNGVNRAGNQVATGTYLARCIVTNKDGGLVYNKTTRMMLIK